MSRLRIVCDPENIDSIALNVMVSELRVVSPDVAERLGYVSAGAIVPDFTTVRELEDEEAKELLIAPDEVDPNDPDIIPLILVRIPAFLGDVAAAACADPDFRQDPLEYSQLATNFRASPLAYREDPHGSSSTTTNREGYMTGLHIDGYRAFYTKRLRFLAANAGGLPRFHCVSDYMVREGGLEPSHEERLQYAQQNPPTPHDRVLWLGTGTHTGSPLWLNYGWITPAADIMHDGSLFQEDAYLRLLPRNPMYLYSLDENTAQVGTLPSPLYPRPAQDAAIYDAWQAETGALKLQLVGVR